MAATRLFDLLEMQVSKNPDNDFLSGKKDGEWQHFTFRKVQELADRFSQWMLELGLQKGDTIAIVSTNRPEWNFADLGALQVGVVVVPIYPTVSQKDYDYIFRDAEVKYAFAGDDSIYQKISPLLGQVPSLKKIYTFDRLNEAEHFWDVLPHNVNAEEIRKRKATVHPGDLATIIYTSGTTGNPKGVMLTHDNIVSNVLAVKDVTPFGDGERALSFLPLCHSFERMVFYAYLSFGIHIYYAESLETIVVNLQEVKPYCFTTVPRLLEKVYDRILEKGEALTGIKRKLFFWAMHVGARYEIGRDKGWWYRLQLSAARKLIFSKWNEALGGNVHFIITGAAAMQPRLITLFTAAGIPIVEGYGLTETSPVLSCNRVEEDERCIGTVGLPIPGVTIRIADDGEILAKGPNIMKGYYKRPDLTAEVIDTDGWFHTGDIGVWLERDGKKFLKITDRKKELFKTAGGKYVAPQVIENKMKESRYIEQIMVVGGDDKKFVSALIVPAFPALQAWAKEQGLAEMSPQELVQQEKVHHLLHAEVKKYNHDFGHWEQVKKFTLLPAEWSVDSGELTPTMKPKRKVIEQRYEQQIGQMYAAAEEAHHA